MPRVSTKVYAIDKCI